MGSLVRRKNSHIILMAIAAIVLFGLLSPPASAGSSLDQRKVQLLEMLGLNGTDPSVIKAAQEANTLYAIDVVPGEDSVAVILQMSQLPAYDSYLYKKDRRLVVDLRNTINLSPTPVQPFPGNDPKQTVRNSQYRVTPSLISRIVLDLDGNETPNISTDGTNIVITTPLAENRQSSDNASVSTDSGSEEVIAVPAVKVDTSAPNVMTKLGEALVPPVEAATISETTPAEVAESSQEEETPTAEAAPVEETESSSEATPAEVAESSQEEETLAAETAPVEETESAPANEAEPETKEVDELAELLPAGEQEPAEPAQETAADEDNSTAAVEASETEAEPVQAPVDENLTVAEEETVQESPASAEPSEQANAATEVSVEPRDQVVEVPGKPAEAPKVVKLAKNMEAAPSSAAPAASAPGPSEGLAKKDNLVTLNFRDADLSAVLDILARKGNLNILAGKDVRGTVTVRLVDVPFDVALNAVLNVNGYGFVQTDNIIRVLPLSQLGSKVETNTETFTLSYAEANKVKTTLQGLLTPNGSIDTDERTNMVIVTDVPVNLKRIRKLMPQIDRRVQQVLIEVLILDSVLGDSADLGIQWNLVNTTDNSPWEGVSNDSYGVTLPFTSTGGLDIALGTMLDDFQLNMLVQAVVDNTDSRILANPKILTVDNEAASIEIVEEFPYNDVTQTSSGGQLSNITFKEIGTKLEVKPQITHDEHVILWINPEQNSIAGTTITGVPIIDTRKAETTLIVKNHQTIVLGGLRENRMVRSMSKVPFLGDLPGVKYAFRSVSSDDRDTELLVFLTVHIVESPPVMAGDKIKFDELANLPRKPSTSIDLIR